MNTWPSRGGCSAWYAYLQHRTERKAGHTRAPAAFCCIHETATEARKEQSMMTSIECDCTLEVRWTISKVPPPCGKCVFNQLQSNNHTMQLQFRRSEQVSVRSRYCGMTARSRSAGWSHQGRSPMDLKRIKICNFWGRTISPFCQASSFGWSWGKEKVHPVGIVIRRGRSRQFVRYFERKHGDGFAVFDDTVLRDVDGPGGAAHAQRGRDHDELGVLEGLAHLVEFQLGMS